jgi:ABC-2 type transport system ATP-binding protein
VSAAITSSGLTKRFRGGQVAVDAIDLDVPRGAVYGFLGPNGSGKTTTIRMLLGLVAATAGTHTLLGEPMPSGGSRVLPAVGALVEGPAFHPYLSGRDNLLRLDAADRTVGARSTRTRTDHALERVGLAAAATKRYRSYSLGMRQRLGLAAALLRPRELLVLDEPTNGLDPQGTREVRSLVRELGAAGATVFVSSHLLPEIEQVCDHVGVMSHGRLVFQGTLAALRQASNPRVRVETSRPDDAATVLRAAGTGAPAVGTTSVTAELVVDGAEPVRTELLAERLVAAGVPVRELVIEGAGLEDLFVGLTGEGFDVDQ